MKEDGEVLPAWRQLECCHFDGRGNQSVRYDEDNALGGCFSCHQYLDAHPLEKIEWFKRNLGEDGFNQLQGRMRITYPKPDKKAIKLYLEERLKALQ